MNQPIWVPLPGRPLYPALNWLNVDRLTLPGVCAEKQSRDLVETGVPRLIPDA